MHKEASTITDIHNTSDSTEVNLISLVCEQIPKYRLRARSPSGYCQQDWLQCPITSLSPDAELSPELYEQTFQYLILSGDRLSQMTQTYHDIEAVTKLLEEKERDLELAATIGQTLLQKNKEAQLCREQLEEQLEDALEEVSQLKHEISLKEDLLHTYANDESDSSSAPSPVKEFRKFGYTGMLGHLEGLHTKIKHLEVNNDQLRLDKAKCESESEELESHEHQLVSDALHELDDARRELKNSRESSSILSEELSQKNDEAVRLQEEVTRLLTQIVYMQRKQKQVALENEELQQHLLAANNAQLELTNEIKILEDQYLELSNALDETREEARLLRDKQMNELVCPIPYSNSLAAELGIDSTIERSSPDQMDSQTNPFAVKSELNCKDKASGNTLGLNSLEHDAHSRSPGRQALDAVKFVNSIRGSRCHPVNQVSTPSKQARPIPTPFPLSLKGEFNSTTSTSYISTTVMSGCSTSTPRLQGGEHVLFKSHPAFKLKLAASNVSCIKPMSSPFDKSIDRLHVRETTRRVPSLHGYKMFGVESRSEGGELLSEQTSLSANKTVAASRCRSTTPCLGRPGIPGTEDLEKAIKKLAFRRESLRYILMERFRARSTDVNSTGNRSMATETPDQSIATDQISNQSLYGISPETSDDVPGRSPKLRIIKPLEGSVTLNQWKYLAGKDRTLQLSKDTQSGVITRDKIIGAQSKIVRSGTKFASCQPGLNSLKLLKSTSASNSNQSGGFVLDKILENTQRANSMLKQEQAIITCASTSSLPLNPGRGFTFTPTKYTFAYSHIKNLDDDFETMPLTSNSVPKMSAMHSGYGLETSNSSVQTLDNLNERSSEKKSLTMLKENTRTCSTELGIAQLLKEHSTKTMHQQVSPTQVKNMIDESISTAHCNEKYESSPSTTMTTSYLRKKEFAGPLVWNRTLKRAFSLSVPSLSDGFASKGGRAAASDKPETPPNSPTIEYEDRHSFFNDGYLQPYVEHDIESAAVRHELPSEASKSSKSGETDGSASLSQENAVSHPPQRLDEELRSTDWSELHGSSGSLFVPSSDHEVKSSANE